MHFRFLIWLSEAQKKYLHVLFNNMQVLPITFNKPHNVNFKANSRWVYDKSGKELYKTTTYLFRDDLDWENLIKYICDKYKNVPKVNFINHVCSNGMEPLSFLISMMLFSPENVKKFTPIIAKDINPENIIMAKKGECGVSSDDFIRIHKITNGRYRDFFNLKHDKNTDGLFTLSPKEAIKNNIIFEQGDIFKDVNNMPKDNTFLCCRNFWAYLPFEQRRKLAESLSEILNPSSTILIGFHDISEARADLHLELCGFKRCPTGTPYVNIMYSKT